MAYLIDTNVLLRLADRRTLQHPTVRTALRTLYRGGTSLYITPQNSIECWNVATRPVDRNGFGFAPADADRMLRLIERLFPVLPNVPSIYPEWRRLVKMYGVSGVQVHDAHLVAAMKIHGLSHILTFNRDDFARYVSEGITAVDPSMVVTEAL